MIVGWFVPLSIRFVLSYNCEVNQLPLIKVPWDVLLEGYDGVCDFPCALFYRELRVRYPAGKQFSKNNIKLTQALIFLCIKTQWSDAHFMPS